VNLAVAERNQGGEQWMKPNEIELQKILAIDLGGTHVKVKHTESEEVRKADSGPTMTPYTMVATVKEMTNDWHFDVVALGYPGAVLHGKIVHDPHNLGPGWVKYDFKRAFGKPVKIINDAAMQALGSYEGGSMLFLGLGTGLGSALIIDDKVEALELGRLPYKGRTYEDFVGKAALERQGHHEWRKAVAAVVEELASAFDADYVVIGGGDARELKAKELPINCRLGDNANAFQGGFRLWAHTEKTLLAKALLERATISNG
jgi:polyphosphate glucokinase